MDMLAEHRNHNQCVMEVRGVVLGVDMAAMNRKIQHPPVDGIRHRHNLPMPHMANQHPLEVAAVIAGPRASIPATIRHPCSHFH